MFSIKALILYILFFAIGWLIARWLWSKKQAEQSSISNLPNPPRHAVPQSTTSSTKTVSDGGTPSTPKDEASSTDDVSAEAYAPESETKNQATTSSADSTLSAGVKSEAVKAKPAKSSSKRSTAGAVEKKSAAPKPVAKKVDEASNPERLSAARDGEADDLKRVKGIGKKNEEKLNTFGIYHFDQIGNWTDEQAEWIGKELSFPGRIEREGWIEQAKVLASGGDTEFSRRADKGKVPSSKG